MHYHKLHISTQTKHTCDNCLISDVVSVCLDKLKLQVQTNSSWPVASLGTSYLSLGAQIICLFSHLYHWHCTAQPRKEKNHSGKQRGCGREKSWFFQTPAEAVKWITWWNHIQDTRDHIRGLCKYQVIKIKATQIKVSLGFSRSSLRDN